MCVDEASGAVLRERFEVTQGFSMQYVLEITRIERDPMFSPEEFKIPSDARDDSAPSIPTRLLDSLPVYSAPGPLRKLPEDIVSPRQTNHPEHQDNDPLHPD
jgi:hypothetical protein